MGTKESPQLNTPRIENQYIRFDKSILRQVIKKHKNLSSQVFWKIIKPILGWELENYILSIQEDGNEWFD